MSKIKFFNFIASAVVFNSCTHSIHQVYTSISQPYLSLENERLIRAYSEQTSVLGFNKNTDFVDKAYVKIQRKCQKGTIKGITTQYSTSHGFFHWKNKILIQGFCVSMSKFK